jgi:hypothetical protein
MKTCTIITTHPPKFHFGLDLLKSFVKYVEQPHELYFVFTNESEMMLFDTLCGEFNSFYKSIVIPNELRDKLSIVNVKKFYALETLINEYDYIGVYDCETLFVKPCNLNLIYEDIGNQNHIKANTSSVGKNVLLKASEMLGLNNNEVLLNETENLTLYWWFNEIPVYEKNNFIEFFSWLKNLENYSDIQREYYCFDYILYGMWLIVFKGVNLKKIETTRISEIGAVEDFRLPMDVRNEVSVKFDSYWSTNIQNFNNFEKIKIIFHIDSI